MYIYVKNCIEAVCESLLQLIIDATELETRTIVIQYLNKLIEQMEKQVYFLFYFCVLCVTKKKQI